MRQIFAKRIQRKYFAKQAGLILQNDIRGENFETPETPETPEFPKVPEIPEILETEAVREAAAFFSPARKTDAFKTASGESVSADMTDISDISASEATSRPKIRGRHKISSKQSFLNNITAFVICAVTGWIFALNVVSNGSITVAADTENLLSARQKTVDSLNSDVKNLSGQIEELSRTAGMSVSETTQNSGADSGKTYISAVTGSGITVTLNDSPLWSQRIGSSDSLTNVNDYVVHQQDVEAVMNALWKGGAEAMMIQDQRVFSTTAVRCVGTVLLVEGKQYAPPYAIKAIGPQDGMLRALFESKSVQTYLEYVRAEGLGFQFSREESMTFPETVPMLQSMKYAKIKE